MLPDAFSFVDPVKPLWARDRECNMRARETPYVLQGAADIPEFRVQPTANQIPRRRSGKNLQMEHSGAFELLLGGQCKLRDKPR